jgi:hypothetical protein
LSESEARLPEDLKFLRDERSLGFIQRRALFSLSPFEKEREHPIARQAQPPSRLSRWILREKRIPAQQDRRR